MVLGNHPPHPLLPPVSSSCPNKDRSWNELNVLFAWHCIYSLIFLQWPHWVNIISLERRNQGSQIAQISSGRRTETKISTKVQCFQIEIGVGEFLWILAQCFTSWSHGPISKTGLVMSTWPLAVRVKWDKGVPKFLAQSLSESWRSMSNPSGFRCYCFDHHVHLFQAQSRISFNSSICIKVLLCAGCCHDTF